MHVYIKRYAPNIFCIDIGGGSTEEISPDDTSTFRTVMLICLAVGGLSSIVFHATVNATGKSSKKVSLVIIHHLSHYIYITTSIL